MNIMYLNKVYRLLQLHGIKCKYNTIKQQTMKENER